VRYLLRSCSRDLVVRSIAPASNSSPYHNVLAAANRTRLSHVHSAGRIQWCGWQGQNEHSTMLHRNMPSVSIAIRADWSMRMICRHGWTEKASPIMGPARYPKADAPCNLRGPGAIFRHALQKRTRYGSLGLSVLSRRDTRDVGARLRRAGSL
jgi:hypothetical protein